jgi:N-acetylglucosaminyldiphosphoundecaprenol N-acetyl-beta-D-mannosaminyltransferase
MSKQQNYPKYNLLGVVVDALTIKEANTYIVTWAKDHSRPAIYVTKPYVEFLDRAATDQKTARLLNEAELCLPDGVALSWAATYLYGGRHTLARLVTTLASIILRPASLTEQFPERFAGANATWSLLEAADQAGLKVLLVGSPHKSDLATTSATITARLPNIKIVGHAPGEINGLSGPMLAAALSSDTSDLSRLVAQIKSSGAELILIGMGFPLQELLMATLKHQLEYGVMVGEGGTFDYDSFGGHATRAPHAIQRLGLEWLWRLILDPTRWRRQLAVPRYISRIYHFGK